MFSRSCAANSIASQTHAQRTAAVSRPHVRRHAGSVRCQQASSSADGSLPSSSGRNQAPAVPGSRAASFRELLMGQTTVAGATGASGFIVLPHMNGSGGGIGGDGGRGGGGGGGGGDGIPGGDGSQPLYDIAEEAEEVSDETATPEPEQKQEDAWKELVTPSDEIEAEEGERSGTNRCVEVVVEGWPQVGSLPSETELKDMLNVQEGHIFGYQDIVDDRRLLEKQYDEYIASVQISTEFVDNKSNHQRVRYKFKPYVYSGIDEISIKGATLMPAAAQEAIIKSCLPDDVYRVDIGVMDKVRAKIEKWYQDRGLPFCYVGYFDGMDEGSLRANVIEAKINDVGVKYTKTRLAGNDSDDEVMYSEGEVVPAERIVQSAGFKKGEHYHIDDGYDAMNNIYACGLLDDINIEPEQDLMDPSKINVRIKVEETEPRSMELDLDWSFQMKGPVPQLSRQALIPGGSVEINHGNLFGDSQSLSVSLSSSDWRSPGADLGFQMSYTEPFYAPNTSRNAQVFNTRKMSPVFTSPVENEAPPVFVDRLGAKGWTSHTGGQDNKVEHALIFQQVTTCDENGQTVEKGTKAARGYYAESGPPTTLSGNGKDLSLSYQHFTALDNVQFVNGNQLGTRMLFQVDQGLNPRIPLGKGRSLGLSGGLYNKCQATFTKFMQMPFLPKLTEDNVWVDRKAPNTLVAHARAGNCIGDMGSYDYFSLGGPYSVRGYGYGELGAARRFLETALEARVPLRNFGLPGIAYAFTEYGSDLGSARGLEGNPTEYYRKPGRGLSYGAGIKLLGACRFEYARDCNAGTGATFVNWGERF
ncbi:75 kDa chloroplast membrane translocon [Dunaliella salina]|uniref:75 kDa chloroplast membrane translocon n=1 Tax=Dunaliella salina TaxID=3046 RepID=A0ABQ7H712_DUNSA|nr:75 kDa chloroplast membrane translocon [Dunaliella salina]|eukprot:KAF5842636.1 75 kDa chloroplast membrane translocon [Dunaliella salina]